MTLLAPTVEVAPAKPAVAAGPATTAAFDSTPGWLLDSQFGACPCTPTGRRRRSYLDRTLLSGAGLLRQVMFADDLAAGRGVLQRLDPRAKILGTVGLLIAAAVLHNIISLALVYVATLVLAAFSGVPLGFFVKRVWLFVPIFTGVVVLPATLSIVTKGDVVLTLWHWHGQPEGFTAQGLSSAGLVISRVAVSTSLVVLLTITTRWTRLLAALRVLGVPRMFVLVIGMAYRYVFHLLGTVEDMYTARKARTIGRPKHDSGSRAFVAASVGVLIGKSHQLSEEVHQAMVARGFRGDAATLDRPRWSTAELAYLLAMLAVAVAVVGVDRLVG